MLFIFYRFFAAAGPGRGAHRKAEGLQKYAALLLLRGGEVRCGGGGCCEAAAAVRARARAWPRAHRAHFARWSEIIFWLMATTCCPFHVRMAPSACSVDRMSSTFMLVSCEIWRMDMGSALWSRSVVSST